MTKDFPETTVRKSQSASGVDSEAGIGYKVFRMTGQRCNLYIGNCVIGKQVETVNCFFGGENQNATAEIPGR